VYFYQSLSKEEHLSFWGGGRKPCDTQKLRESIMFKFFHGEKKDVLTMFDKYALYLEVDFFNMNFPCLEYNKTNGFIIFSLAGFFKYFFSK